MMMSQTDRQPRYYSKNASTICAGLPFLLLVASTSSLRQVLARNPALTLEYLFRTSCTKAAKRDLSAGKISRSQDLAWGIA